MSWTFTLLGTLAILVSIILLRRYFYLVKVDGYSMQPALIDGDIVLAIRVWPKSFLFRGQVIVWLGDKAVMNNAGPFTLQERLYIKRIIGLPGDRISTNLPDRETKWMSEDKGLSARFPKKVWNVPPGHLFVVGDTPGLDSRSLGPIPATMFRGLVVLKLPRRGTNKKFS